MPLKERRTQWVTQAGRQIGKALFIRAGFRPVGLREAGLLALVSAACLAAGSQTQHRPLDPAPASQPQTAPRRTHLILKDGSYQVVLSYKVVGDRVRYRSAERNGEEEEIPLVMVDLAATQAWEKAHDPATADAASSAQQPTTLSPELAREEAQRAARTPEIAKDLRLPDEDSVLALDVYRGTAELVPLPQNGSDLNRETAHAVLKQELNPAASPHDLFLIKDERADVQLHVPDPVFFVRLSGAGDTEEDGGGFVVDTQGQAGRSVPSGSSAQSTYVLERVDVRQGARAIASLRPAALRSGKQQQDIVNLHEETLPGGVWKKLTPVEPLEFGEYALLELLSDRAVNRYVWDFGVHPSAKENDEALRPEVKRPAQLERRRR